MKHSCTAGLGALLLIAAAIVPASVAAHPLSPSLLELREHSGGNAELRWTTPVGRPWGRVIAPILPQDCRPAGAAETLRGATRLSYRQRLSCAGNSLVGKTIGVEGLAESKTSAIVRIRLADGRRIDGLLSRERAAMTIPDARPRKDVAIDYLHLGIEHIFGGIDHLLFVLALVLLTVGSTPNRRGLVENSERRRRGRVLSAVTAFTAGHSVTLSAAFLGYAQAPRRLVESGIAFSIAILAAELAAPPRRGSLLRRRPWTAAFGFGLLHGFGFAAALSAAGLAEASIPLALASFNCGIEVGQLIFVAAILLALAALRRGASAARIESNGFATRVPAYGIGIVAAFWTLQRLFTGL